jgi:hypothetical protein
MADEMAEEMAEEMAQLLAQGLAHKGQKGKENDPGQDPAG